MEDKKNLAMDVSPLGPSPGHCDLGLLYIAAANVLKECFALSFGRA